MALAFTLLALNPFGGLLVAIPFAVFAMGCSAWVAALAGIPLSYVQVLAVDGAWSQLERAPWFRRLVEKRRSARLERLTQGGGSFVPTMVVAPLIGPWLVMAVMRYAQVPHRRVALPILLGLGWNAAAVAAGCVLFPAVFAPGS